MKLRRKIARVFLIFGALFFVISCVFLALVFVRPKNAGLFVETDVPAEVFVNGKLSGKTPFESMEKPGEVWIKVVPEGNLKPYEKKIHLVAGIKTAIKRIWKESPEGSIGVVAYFKRFWRGSSLSVVTDPEKALVLLDTHERGYTPYYEKGISPGRKELVIRKEGFEDLGLGVEIMKGYELVVIAELKKTPQQKEEDIDGVTMQESVKMVEILETPTGFLRLRKEASSIAAEVGQVRSGKKCEFIYQDKKTGWFKIRLEDGTEGFVSNKYARLVEAE